MQLTTKQSWVRYVPNALTVFRLFLIPVFFYTFYQLGLFLPDRLLALFVFMLASMTDLLDGYVARKYNAITNFGRLADPVADKLMTLSALFCLYETKRIRLFILVLVLSKEALMLIGSYIMLKFHIVVYSKWYGKAAVFVMSLGIVLTFWDKTYPWNLYLLYFSLVLTLYAFFHYFRLAARQLKEIKDHPDNPRDIYAEED